MPRDQAMPRLLESGRVELASQTTDELLDVVSRLGVGERVEEHPFLHRREGIQILDAPFVRERSRTTPRGRRRLEPVQTERRDVLDVSLEFASLRRRFGRRRKLGDVRVPEQVRGVEGQPCLSCSRHDLDAEDRVDTDLEEVVVDADAAPSQQVRP